MRDFILSFMVMILFSIFAFFGTVKLAEMSCSTRAVSFKSYKFYKLGGCMVEVRDGFYMPLENVRDVPRAHEREF